MATTERITFMSSARQSLDEPGTASADADSPARQQSHRLLYRTLPLVALLAGLVCGACGFGAPLLLLRLLLDLLLHQMLHLHLLLAVAVHHVVGVERLRQLLLLGGAPLHRLASIAISSKLEHAQITDLHSRQKELGT